MDPLAQARTNASQASEGVAQLQESIPGLLAGLRKNLVSIYQKDNPLVQARETHLADYLSAADRARAEYLPANQPTIAGSPLNYSPTQLQAMVSGRQAAALAPLLGTNQAIMAGYGNIGDIVSGAGNIYQSQLEAAKTRATGVMDWYKQLVAEQQFKEQEARLAKSGAGTGMDPTTIAALIAAISAGQQQPEEQPEASRPDPAQFDDDISPLSTSNRAPLPQQIQALPSSGFSLGLPTGLTGPGGVGERIKAWGSLIMNGLRGGG